MIPAAAAGAGASGELAEQPRQGLFHEQLGARRLGYKVRTFASEQREDGRRAVCVVVTESTEQDQTRVQG
jgi:hypothetical protein